MGIIGVIYVVLIVGWILIVIFLKCKKTITPHFAFTDNYTDAMADRRPSIHIIHLPNDNEDSIMESSYHHNEHGHGDSLRRHSHRSQRSINSEERMIESTYPTDAVINPAYMHDDDYIINAPPPSYEEVMRQPEIYPQVHQANSRKNSAGHI